MPTKMIIGVVLAAALLFSPVDVSAQSLDSGDTAWLATATALVLFMAVPGLALFYGGMVRAGSVVSVMVQCIAITCLVTILWLVAGYSLAFGDSLAVVGALNKVLYRGLGEDVLWGSIPELMFATFQLTFAVIASVLLVGTLVERLRLSAVLLFTAFWTLLVYAPVAHWVWGGGWLGDIGVLDFAGGIVVHVTAGATALVAILVLGPRPDFPARVPPPHNLTLMFAGAGMLWVGWMGFNGGSAMAADGNAGLAMAATQISAAAGAFTWMLLEWLRRGRPSALGTVTGAIAGLAAVTPAAGFVGPGAALLIGMSAGVVCLGAVLMLRNVLRWDDSVDVVSVHMVGGALGTLFTGVLAHNTLGLFGGQESFSIVRQIIVQLFGLSVTIIYTMVVSWVILVVVNVMVRQRVSRATLADGLDIAIYDERGYVLDGPSVAAATGDNISFAAESHGQRAGGETQREGAPFLSADELRGALSAEDPRRLAVGEGQREDEPLPSPDDPRDPFAAASPGRQAAGETQRESEPVLSPDDLRAVLSAESSGGQHERGEAGPTKRDSTE